MAGVLKWGYTILYTAFFAMLPYLYVTHKEYMLQLLVAGFVFNFLDLAVSEEPWKNIELIKKNGYSMGIVLVYTILNIISYQANWIFISYITLNSVEIVYYFDIWLILKICITLIIGDIYFYFAHKLLHETDIGSNLHLLHHCCLYTSMSTGLCFNPIDLLLEFTAPNINLLIMYYIFDDPCFLVIVGTITLVWYAMSHDENLKMHHYTHHTDCNGDYPIYKEWRVYNKKDKIKRLIKM